MDRKLVPAGDTGLHHRGGVVGHVDWSDKSMTKKSKPATRARVRRPPRRSISTTLFDPRFLTFDPGSALPDGAQEAVDRDKAFMFSDENMDFYMWGNNYE